MQCCQHGWKRNKRIKRYPCAGQAFFYSEPSPTGFLATSQQIQLSCSPLCHIGWYRNGSYIKNTSILYTILTQRVDMDTDNNQAQSTHSTLKFNINKWPLRRLDHTQDNTEYSCQSTSNCKGSQTNFCEGVKSLTHFEVEFPP